MTSGGDVSSLSLLRAVAATTCTMRPDLWLDVDRLTVRSLPGSAASSLSMDLTADGAVVTGTWVEQTDHAGYYRGARYHGAIQLPVEPTGRRMAGNGSGSAITSTQDHIGPRNWVVASMSRLRVPGSEPLWPASSTMWNVASGQTRCRSQAWFGGVLMS